MTTTAAQIINQIKIGQIPDGYKKTKAGIIPADWEIHPLSQHLSESRIPGSNGSIAKKLSVKLWNKGVCEKREVHSGSESTKYYKRKKGQFIYSKLDFLNCAFGIIPEELDGYESTIDLPCFDLSDVNDYYFLSYITQPKFYSHYGMLADGGRKARRVDPEEMLSFPLIFPPLPEQQKIAKILATQDKVIELKEKLLEQKQTQKKWLMQKLLSNDGTTFMLGGVRIDKSGWKNTKLGDVCFFINGRAYKQEELLSEGKYKVLRVGNLFTNENWYYSDLELSENKYIDHGDLIFAWSTSFCPIIWGGEKVIYHYHIWKLEITGSIRQEYLYYVLLFDVNLLTNETQGGTMIHITKENMEKREILLPPLPEQQAIAEVLSTADKEIDLLKSDIEQEKQKKKALMQLLLTGIVRVKL